MNIGKLNLNKISNFLDLIEQVNNSEYKTIEELLKLYEEYKRIYIEEKDKLPFSINLLELIRPKINENAHSRILKGLLQYKSSGTIKYPIANRLMNIVRLHGCDIPTNLTIEDVYAEKARIDLLIKAKECGIIIENKVENAVDQTAQNSNTGSGQLYRYINRMRKCYNDENIYILYLVRDELHNPNKGSWENNKGISLEDKFKDRFCVLSYKYDILLDMEKMCAEGFETKEYLLQSTVIQYVDYLQDIFKTNAKYKEMNERIENLLIKKLNLEDLTTIQCMLKLSNTLDEIDNLKDTIKDLSKKYITKMWKEWETKLKLEVNKHRWNDISPIDIKMDQDENEIYKLYVIFSIESYSVEVYIWIDKNDDYLIGVANATNIKIRHRVITNKKSIIKEVLPDMDDDINEGCYFCQYVPAEEVYDKFITLIDVLHK